MDGVQGWAVPAVNTTCWLLQMHGCRLTCTWKLHGFFCFYAILGHFTTRSLTVIGYFCRSNVSDLNFRAINSYKMEPTHPLTHDDWHSCLWSACSSAPFSHFRIFSYQRYSPAGGFSFCMKFKLKKHLWCLKIEQSIPALLKPNLGHKTKMNIIILPSNPKTDSQTRSCMGLTTSSKI